MYALWNAQPESCVARGVRSTVRLKRAPGLAMRDYLPPVYWLQNETSVCMARVKEKEKNKREPRRHSNLTSA